MNESSSISSFIPTILAVDDEYDIVEMYKYAFENFTDYKCLTAHNGLEALDRIKNNEINLVITDIDMPIMSGIELINKLENSNKGLNIIVITANYDVSENFVSKTNVKAILNKPPEFKTLFETVKKLFH